MENESSKVIEALQCRVAELTRGLSDMRDRAIIAEAQAAKIEKMYDKLAVTQTQAITARRAMEQELTLLRQQLEK